MKNYSELRDTKQYLDVLVKLTTVGNPEYTVLVNNKGSNFNFLHPLLEPICFSVIIKNKNYDVDGTSLVIVESLSIDGINLIPKFNHLTQYENDRATGLLTNCLGFNGRWTLDIDQPFYQWLHRATNQGWLLSPIS